VADPAIFGEHDPSTLTGDAQPLLIRSIWREVVVMDFDMCPGLA
jgi:hypothetical protein